jgi:hypothetical protein
VTDYPETEAGKFLLRSIDEAAPGTAFEGMIAEVEAEARADALREVGELRAALRDANAIVSMTRKHLAEDHPECAYEALGVLNDATRAALSQPPAPDPT